MDNNWLQMYVDMKLDEMKGRMMRELKHKMDDIAHKVKFTIKKELRDEIVIELRGKK